MSVKGRMVALRHGRHVYKNKFQFSYLIKEFFSVWQLFEEKKVQFKNCSNWKISIYDKISQITSMYICECFKSN